MYIKAQSLCQKPQMILSQLEQDLLEWALKLTNVSSLNDAVQLVWIINFIKRGNLKTLLRN